MDIIKNLIRYSVLVFLILPLYAEVDYNFEIQPIFDNNCISCHIDGGAYFGGLDLSSYSEVMEGGNSGNVIVPFEYANSLLWQHLNSNYMPPYGSGVYPLTTNQINLIAQWINEGALFESNDLMFGDVNDDGVVNVLDVVLLVNSILNGDSANDYPQADLNQDGLLNVLDVVLIVNIILN